MVTYLPGTGTLGGGTCAGRRAGLGILAPKMSLQNFGLPHVGVGPAHSVSVPLLLVCMGVVSLIS